MGGSPTGSWRLGASREGEADGAAVQCCSKARGQADRQGKKDKFLEDARTNWKACKPTKAPKKSTHCDLPYFGVNRELNDERPLRKVTGGAEFWCMKA